MPKPNKIIVLEGIDGSGKSSLATFVKLKIEQVDPTLKVEILQEPGSTDLGKVVRKVIKDPNIDLTPLQQLTLLTAGMEDTFKILANNTGTIYIVDRTVISTLVYQKCFSPDEEYWELFYGVKSLIKDYFVEHLTKWGACMFILDVPAELSLSRQQSRGDYEDRFKADLVKTVSRRDSYKHWANALNIPIIDSAGTLDNTWQQIESKLSTYLGLNFMTHKHLAENALNHLMPGGAITQKLEALIHFIHQSNLLIQYQTGEDRPELNEHLFDSIVAGIKFKLENPESTPADQHKSWCEFKTADGWVYGETKDFTAKTHPCLVPYEQLPSTQRLKDDNFARTLALGLRNLGLQVWEV